MNKKFIPSYVPDPLKGMKCWCVWKLVWSKKEGRYKKIPFSIRGEAGCQNKPDQWTTYEEALDVLRNSVKYDGVGICLHKSFGIVFVDIDHCISEDGIINETAVDILNRFKSETYIEYSQSKTGLHILAFGAIPKTIKTAEVEMYSSGRFCAFTGIPFVETGIRYAQAALSYVWNKYAGKEKPRGTGTQSIGQEKNTTKIERFPVDFTVAGIVAKLTKSQKYGLLFFNGDWNEAGYSTQSDADIALCGQLAFWCNRDKELIDTIFRQSAMYRDKWDEVHDSAGHTYGWLTIEKACCNLRESLPEWKKRQRAEKWEAIEELWK